MGLPLVIENPAGSMRRWVDTDGTPGETLMRFPYGYLAGAIGADGEDVDVYLGPVDEPDLVFIVHQRKKGDANVEVWPDYDEDKVMLGWASADDAMAAYLAQYDDRRVFGGMSVFTRDGFLALLQERGYDPDAVSAQVGCIAHADAMEDSTARMLLEQAYSAAQQDLRSRGVESMARLAGERTSQIQRRELAQQIRAGLGVDVAIDESRTRDVLRFFAAENATKIANLPEEMHARISDLTMRALSKRMKPETYAEELRKIIDVGESRARQIARDQIGSLNGQLTEIRQLELGITHYIWETKRDDRVRDSHAAREGERFPWARPPAGGHPGQDYGCRCGARPDLSGVLAAVEKQQKAVEPFRWTPAPR
jgi:SPP1 gp7 family putative phage head morphogenesis protein